jgi:hypothetical protein
MGRVLWIAVIILVALGAFVLINDADNSASTGDAISSYNYECGKIFDSYRAGYSVPTTEDLERLNKCSFNDFANYARTQTDYKGECYDASQDTSGDGKVGIEDLMNLFEDWMNGAEGVNEIDMLTMFESWGSC